jgi:hypothetical protein
MKKLLKNPFSILTEIVTLVLAVLWYKHTCGYEPLIAMISSLAALITSISLIYCSRPKIELFAKRMDYGRNNQGFSSNNPPIITAGAKDVNIHWKLFWHYTIEIRNNSSQNAYSISFEYLNMPKNVRIDNQIGEREPILANEMKTINLKLIETIESTIAQAEKRLKEDDKNLLPDATIILKYKDESGSIYGTKFTWANNSNKLYKPCWRVGSPARHRKDHIKKRHAN